MFSLQKKTYSARNDKVVLVLSGWGAKQWQMWFVGKLLQAHGYTAIIYTYDKSLLTPNVKQTVKNFKEVKNNALRTIATLSKKEQKNLVIFGTSIGSSLSLMIANESKEIKKIILNLVGSDIAQIVWSWDKVIPGFKKDLLEDKVTFETLKNAWLELSPIHNLDNLKKKAILLYGAKHDEIIPFSQTEELIATGKEKRLNIETVINTTHNHRTSAIVHYLKYTVYVAFLQKR